MSNALLERFRARYPPGHSVDLTDSAQLTAAQDLADALRTSRNAVELSALARAMCAKRDEHPLLAHLAVKLALSKSAVREIEQEALVSVVFAVYNEHRRILPRSEHPAGEDFLNRKVEQLEWLTAGSNLGWELLVVDDGCPEETGRIAEEVVAARGYAPRVKVLHLADAIAGGHRAAEGLRTTNDSRKGGSILYGMWEAAAAGVSRHVVAYTDADLSTHLGQTGLLATPILGGVPCAAGSRREPESVVVKGGSRNDRGKLFIYLWKRLLPQLGEVVDTQCGFKAFEAGIVPSIVSGALEKRFAFDIELMLRTELQRADAIERVPVAWFDSEAESTTTDLQPYLSMLQAVAAMYRSYLPRSPEAEPFAEAIEALDEAAWQRLVDNIPEEITSREPRDFGTFDGVSATALRRLSGIGSR